jgi:hypothetical protein
VGLSFSQRREQQRASGLEGVAVVLGLSRHQPQLCLRRESATAGMYVLKNDSTAGPRASLLGLTNYILISDKTCGVVLRYSSCD